jgi:hypothetical protein
MTDIAHPDVHRIAGRWRLARGLEGGGYYNAAKLIWALAYSDEVRLSRIAGLPTGEESLANGLRGVQEEIASEGGSADIVKLLGLGKEAVTDRRELLRDEAGDVAVCQDCGNLLIGVLPERCPECGAWGLTFHVFMPGHLPPSLEPARVVDALEATPVVVQGLLRGLTEDQAASPPSPGEWSLREGIHHLLVTEMLLSGRMGQILETDHPRLAGLAAWAEPLEGDSSAVEVYERFDRSRRATVDRLRGLSLGQWARRGEHEEFGPVTLLQQAAYFARHDHSHLAQLEAIRNAIIG